MEQREAKLILNKAGNGYYTSRATLPTNWIKAMGLDEDNRELILSFDGKKIIIEKKNKI